MKTRYYLCLACIIIICALCAILSIIAEYKYPNSAEKIETDPYEWVCNLDGNLTDIQLKDRALKCMLKKTYKSINISAEEFRNMERKIKKQYGKVDDEFYNFYSGLAERCGGNNRPDKACEFFIVDDNINLEYFMGLGDRACNGKQAVANFKDFVNMSMLKGEVVYPWENNNSLILSDGNLKYKLYFSGLENDKHVFDMLFTEKIFLNEINPKIYDHKYPNDKIFSIPTDMLFFDMYVSLIDKKYDNFCNLYNFKKKDIKPYKAFFELEGRKYSRYAFYLGIFDENYTYKYDIKDNLLGVEQGYYYDEKTKEIKREQ